MRGTGVLVVVMAIAASTAAHANPSQEQADKLFVEGRELLKAGDAKGACDKFEAANKLDPAAPGLMLNLGLCYEKQTKLATALRWFREAEKAAAASKLPDYARDAKAHISDLENKVAKLTIDVSSAPADVQITVDGTRIENLGTAIELDSGPHAIEAAASDHEPFSEKIELSNGQTRTVHVIFKAKAETPPVTETPSGPSPWRRRGLGIGVAVVGGGVAIYSGITAKTTQTDYNEGRIRKEPTTKMTVLGVTTVAGVLAVGAGVYLFVTAPKAERRETVVAPVVTTDQVGFAISGWF